jgi:hypothetical protein
MLKKIERKKRRKEAREKERKDPDSTLVQKHYAFSRNQINF